ncbi:SHOCT domain-containing protein [Nocardia colli]|uniref:SHOCT domain-containing protein n=1 Tax=Nocardia colli TaxID=2545717 RepID=UPI0035E05A58
MERAARLHEQGLLSDQEFAELKQQLLQGNPPPPPKQQEQQPAAGKQGTTVPEPDQGPDPRIAALLVAGTAAFAAARLRGGTRTPTAGSLPNTASATSGAGLPRRRDVIGTPREALSEFIHEADKPTGQMPAPGPGDPMYALYQSLAEYRQNFWDATGWTPFGKVIHHAIEQWIFDKFPGIFEEFERNLPENLRAIWNEDNSDLHLSKLRLAWDFVYEALRGWGILPRQPQSMRGPAGQLAREALLAWMMVIDILFGSEFVISPDVLNDSDFEDILRALGLTEKEIAAFGNLTREQKLAVLQMLLDGWTGQLHPYKDYNLPVIEREPAPSGPSPRPGTNDPTTSAPSRQSPSQTYPSSPSTTTPPTPRERGPGTESPSDEPGTTTGQPGELPPRHTPDLPNPPTGYYWKPDGAGGYTLYPKPDRNGEWIPDTPLPEASPGYTWEYQNGTWAMVPAPYDVDPNGRPSPLKPVPSWLPTPPDGYYWNLQPGTNSNYQLAPSNPSSPAPMPSQKPDAPAGYMWADTGNGMELIQVPLKPPNPDRNPMAPPLPPRDTAPSNPSTSGTSPGTGTKPPPGAPVPAPGQQPGKPQPDKPQAPGQSKPVPDKPGLGGHGPGSGGG